MAPQTCEIKARKAQYKYMGSGDKRIHCVHTGYEHIETSTMGNDQTYRKGQK